MHYIRRGHLYFGLFLLPWVILYGITAFLFNHPAAFSDQPTPTSFDKAALAGTPMETPNTAAVEASRVVEVLNARAKDEEEYTLIEPNSAKYSRSTATVTAKDGDRTLTVSMNIAGDGGLIRARTAPTTRPTVEAAPFAVGGRQGGGPGGGRGGARGGRGGPAGAGREGGRGGAGRGGADVLALSEPLHERVKAAAPIVLERAGFAAVDVTVTAVPDLNFKLSDGEKIWDATYNALTGTVSGKPAETPTVASELSARRFLLRLHTMHGYGDDVGYRSAWAVVVDSMAFVMVFWGASGMLMWWQIKATRKLGLVIVLLSILAAIWMGIGMHDLFVTASGRGG
jgi:hypothetical protein